MTERAQVILIWWGLLFMYGYGFCLWGLLDMMPPPPATLSVEEVAAFYLDNHLRIRAGSMITSWISAFMVPIAVVVSVQLMRLEKGVPVLSILQFAGGILMSMFLVFPPIVWGAAAFTAERMPEVTAGLHELGTLTLVTTDQYFIFQMVPIAWLSLTRKHDEYSAFPRWLGYLTIWAAVMFEIGAIAFVPKIGPFAWDGTFVFWFPLLIFGAWVTAMCFTMLRAIRRQREAGA